MDTETPFGPRFIFSPILQSHPRVTRLTARISGLRSYKVASKQQTNRGRHRAIFADNFHDRHVFREIAGGLQRHALNVQAVVSGDTYEYFDRDK
jgi:hypothetical protein